MSSKPLVSILINNYNYGRFLGDAIDSALNQSYPKIEVVVVDDGSNDNSSEVISSYNGQVIPILKGNGGQASAFNVGFENCYGEIICFLDSDDVFKGNKILEIISIFQENLDIGWCFHPLQYIGCDTEEYAEIYTGKSGKYDLRKDMARGKLKGRLPFHGIATSGLCFRRSLLEKMLPMPPEIHITSDDYLKYIAFGTSPGFVTLKTLSQQRLHGNNAYTFRSNKLRLRAKVQVLTSYWMKKNFPFLFKFSNSTFALGVSLYWVAGGPDFEHKALIQEYLATTNCAEKIEIYSRIAFYRLKWLAKI